ncbi:MAG: phosphohistidine phosphatase SixA [Chthoniobacterales bacterium]|jgi:phosphohistidine phosphatase
MLLYLLRHAEAEALAKSDRLRQLTPKGEQQAAKVGKFCLKHGIEPTVILTSPVVRARQTADRVAKSLTGAEMIEAPWAACGMDAFRAMEELAAYHEFPAVMLVGHQPDLGFLAATLLGMENMQNLRVRKALLASIDTAAGLKAGAGKLQFFLPVRLM